MPGGRLELPRGCPRWILSPLRLPFRHPGKTLSILSISHELVKDTQTQVKKRAPGKPFEKTAKTALSLRRRTAGHRLRGAKGAGTFEQFLSIVRLNISDGSAVEEPEFLRGQPDWPLPFFPPEGSGADNSLEKADQSADNSAAALGKGGLRGAADCGQWTSPRRRDVCCRTFCSRRWYPIRNETAVQRAGSPAGFRRKRRPCRGLEAICQGGPDGDALYNINPNLDVTDAGNFLRFGGQYRSIRIGNLV